MNIITNLFQSLSLNSTRTRTLLAFADTEGTPHRGNGESSLWDMCIIFKHVVDGNDFKIIEDCFHVCHVSLPKNQSKKNVKSVLRHHFSTVAHLKEEHKCDNICLCFWGAPHDNAVLNYYNVLDFDTVDLLTCARHCSDKKYDSYSIGKLCKQFNVRSDESIHTGLGDTLRMIDILPRVGIDSPEKMPPFKNHKSKHSSNTKHNVETTTAKRYSGTTIKKNENRNGKSTTSGNPRAKAVERAKQNATI